jgi:hypothetical protein
VRFESDVGDGGGEFGGFRECWHIRSVGPWEGS